MLRTARDVRALSGCALAAYAAAVLLAVPAMAQMGPAAGQRANTYGEVSNSDTGLRGTIPATGRPIVRDGDLSYPRLPEPVQDGILTPDVAEEAGVVADPALVDQRSAEELAAFETAPAGYDPLLFQIEDIAPSDPALNRRPRRLFELEPYDPVGIKIGSFVLFPEVEISGAWYSNLFASPVPESDRAIQILPSGRLVSNWSAHALELRAAGDYSFYDEYPSENDKGYLLEARGRLDFTRRTNLQALASRQRSNESRSAIDASTVGPPSIVTQERASSTLSHRFNRLTLQLTGTLTDTRYDMAGATAPDDRDSAERALGMRASWEFKPTLFAFAAIEGNERSFEHAATSDNLSRDSNGRRYLGGISFGDTGEVLRGEISAGYGLQDFDVPGVADIDGVLVEANLAWRINALTSLMFTAGTDLSETTTVGSGGVIEHRAGIEARHAFRQSLIGSAGIEGMKRSYAGIDVDETQLALRMGLEYFLSREAIVFTRYEHIAFRSDFAGGDYDADEFRLGLRLRR